MLEGSNENALIEWMPTELESAGDSGASASSSLTDGEDSESFSRMASSEGDGAASGMFEALPTHLKTCEVSDAEVAQALEDARKLSEAMQCAMWREMYCEELSEVVALRDALRFSEPRCEQSEAFVTKQVRFEEYDGSTYEETEGSSLEELPHVEDRIDEQGMPRLDILEDLITAKLRSAGACLQPGRANLRGAADHFGTASTRAMAVVHELEQREFDSNASSEAASSAAMVLRAGACDYERALDAAESDPETGADEAPDRMVAVAAMQAVWTEVRAATTEERVCKGLREELASERDGIEALRSEMCTLSDAIVRMQETAGKCEANVAQHIGTLPNLSIDGLSSVSTCSSQLLDHVPVFAGSSSKLPQLQFAEANSNMNGGQMQVDSAGESSPLLGVESTECSLTSEAKMIRNELVILRNAMHEAGLGTYLAAAGRGNLAPESEKHVKGCETGFGSFIVQTHAAVPALSPQQPALAVNSAEVELPQFDAMPRQLSGSSDASELCRPPDQHSTALLSAFNRIASQAPTILDAQCLSTDAGSCEDALRQSESSKINHASPQELPQDAAAKDADMVVTHCDEHMALLSAFNRVASQGDIASAAAETDAAPARGTPEGIARSFEVASDVASNSISNAGARFQLPTRHPQTRRAVSIGDQTWFPRCAPRDDRESAQRLSDTQLCETAPEEVPREPSPVGLPSGGSSNLTVVPYIGVQLPPAQSLSFVQSDHCPGHSVSIPAQDVADLNARPNDRAYGLPPPGNPPGCSSAPVGVPLPSALGPLARPRQGPKSQSPISHSSEGSKTLVQKSASVGLMPSGSRVSGDVQLPRARSSTTIPAQDARSLQARSKDGASVASIARHHLRSSSPPTVDAVSPGAPLIRRPQPQGQCAENCREAQGPSRSPLRSSTLSAGAISTPLRTSPSGPLSAGSCSLPRGSLLSPSRPSSTAVSRSPRSGIGPCGSSTSQAQGSSGSSSLPRASPLRPSRPSSNCASRSPRSDIGVCGPPASQVAQLPGSSTAPVGPSNQAKMQSRRTTQYNKSFTPRADHGQLRTHEDGAKHSVSPAQAYRQVAVSSQVAANRVSAPAQVTVAPQPSTFKARAEALQASLYTKPVQAPFAAVLGNTDARKLQNPVCAGHLSARSSSLQLAPCPASAPQLVTQSSEARPQRSLQPPQRPESLGSAARRSAAALPP